MTSLHSRRDFMGTLGALAAGSLASSSNVAEGRERDGREHARTTPDVVVRTLAATCKVLVPKEMGTLPGERSEPNFGSGVLVNTPLALKDMVGLNQMVILTAAHNFTDAPANVALRVEFFAPSPRGVGVLESLSARILATDRSFKRTDDVAFVVVDLPSDPSRAAELRRKALTITAVDTFIQFAPVASVGFSGGNCAMFDDIRWLDVHLEQHSGNDWLLMSGFVEPGHSGAPLVNETGELIGLVSGAHTRARSISQGESVDFLRSWELSVLIDKTPDEVARLHRQEDTRYTPGEIRTSQRRIMGPSSSAILDFAAKVHTEYTSALSHATTMVEQQRALASQVGTSNLPDSSKMTLSTWMREGLTTKIGELFAPVGGTPTALTEQINGIGR